jgi:beta-glucuronidase
MKAFAVFPLSDPGQETIVDYEKYGVFTGTGTAQYHYAIRDREGLSGAVGEGIYPNAEGLLKDFVFQAMRAHKKLDGSAWDYLNSDQTQAAFYKWASSHDQPAGIKQFYTAMALENAGLYAQAIKAYQAAVVHFPTAYAHTSWGTPWYIGPTALDSVSWLIRQHPELKMRLEGGRVRIQHRYDYNPRNEVFAVDPGRIVPNDPPPDVRPRPDLTSLPIERQLGTGKVHLTEYVNGHWRLFAGKRPYTVRGITYNVSPVGKSPDNGTLEVHRDWMIADENKNGKIDGPYDSWVDKNRNNRQDPDEPVVGDFKLMQRMGVNTIRLYHHEYNKKLLRDLYRTYGIRVMMGDLLGAYTVGSDAEWAVGTDYRDPEQRRKMLASVREMVERERDEAYLLLWVLGNENNYGPANNSRKFPEAYYSLVNEAALLIKSLDREHPVAVANGDLTFIETVASLCPDVDIFGANAYHGRHGMGDSFWEDAAELWGKPVLITEFGCPAYHHSKSEAEAEVLQAEVLKNNWEDIERNMGGGPGQGNSLGGVIYEWMDEWWKAGPPPAFDPGRHSTTGQFQGPFPDGWSYEEWYGIVSQGDGRHSPFLRQLRPAYYVFKDQLWK